MIVTSREGPEAIIAMAHRKESPYQLSILKGTLSFSGPVGVQGRPHRRAHPGRDCQDSARAVQPEIGARRSSSTSGTMSSRRRRRRSPTSASRASRCIPTRAIRKRLTSSTCPSGMRWAKAWPFPAFPPGKQIEDPGTHAMGGYPPRSQSHLQEVQHPDDAAGGEFRYLHQVHAVLVAVSGHLLRRYPGRSVRRQHAGLLRLRRLRGRLPGAPTASPWSTRRNSVTTPASGRLEEGQRRVQDLVGGKDQIAAGTLARFPLPRAVQRAGSRNARNRAAKVKVASRESLAEEKPLWHRWQQIVEEQHHKTDETALITGSEAIAVACKLADVDVITAYPIRPYDTVMQYVAKLVANGEMDCEYIVAEGEHSQFEIVKHASAVGARVFSAPAAWAGCTPWRR